eukprot:4734714-Prymnesium_polylepis.1
MYSRVSHALAIADVHANTTAGLPAPPVEGPRQRPQPPGWWRAAAAASPASSGRADVEERPPR